MAETKTLKQDLENEGYSNKLYRDTVYYKINKISAWRWLS